MPQNDNPFAPWNSPMHEDSPFAAHNGIDADNPSSLGIVHLDQQMTYQLQKKEATVLNQMMTIIKP